jgi:hypothetical protein
MELSIQLGARLAQFSVLQIEFNPLSCIAPHTHTLLCQTTDDFTYQGENTGAQWVKNRKPSCYQKNLMTNTKF